MTYNVFGGTLNLAQSQSQSLGYSVCHPHTHTQRAHHPEVFDDFRDDIQLLNKDLNIENKPLTTTDVAISY